MPSCKVLAREALEATTVMKAAVLGCVPGLDTKTLQALGWLFLGNLYSRSTAHPGSVGKPGRRSHWFPRLDSVLWFVS